MNIGYHPGYTGAFTREEAPGAIPNGTKVVKVRSEPGDAHQIGAKATVLGSITHPTEGIAYFVEWSESPRLAVAVVADKVARVG